MKPHVIHLYTFFFIKSSHPIIPPTKEEPPTNNAAPNPIVAPIEAPTLLAVDFAEDTTSFAACPVAKNNNVAIMSPITEGVTIINPIIRRIVLNFDILVAIIDLADLQALQSNLISINTSEQFWEDETVYAKKFLKNSIASSWPHLA
jgi:hypothetical protein